MLLDSMPTVAFDYDVDTSGIGASITTTGNNNNVAAGAGIQSPPPTTTADNSIRMMNNNPMMTSLPAETMSSGGHNLDIITNYVDSFLQADSFFPQLTELLKVSPGFVSISGRRDFDYPNLEEYGNSLKTLSQFVGLKTIPLPKLLIEQFGQMVQRCEMGIFTSIGRAWLAIDTNVYLWKYDTGTDVAYYDALSRMIIKVELVKPKQGVLKSHIKYILVLVTFTEIILLGITFSDLNNPDGDLGDLLVMPDPLFTIPTDNVEVKVIQSTDDGRIFFGGNDGSLYEIHYQSDNGWFGGQSCHKINHSISSFAFLVPKILKNSKQIPIIQIDIDKARNILYTLNEEGDIEVYDLGIDGKSVQRIIQKSIQSITREAIAAASAIDEINFKSIVSINSIEECESIYINLVAVTKTGVRLYFTATSLNSPEQRPFGLSLLHIRLPPGFAASCGQHRPTAVQQTYYKKRNFIFISYQTDNKDTLWSLSSDSFAFRNELSELYTIIPLKTRIWSMAEETNIIEYKPFQSLFFKNKTFVLETPAIVTQHIEMPRKFIFLTTQGVIIGYKPRLIDQLKQLLIENQGYDNDSVKSFFHLHNFSSFQSNACVFALILACDSQPTGEEKLIEWATSAFFHYGTEMLQQTSSTFGMAQTTSTPFISTPLTSPSLMPVISGSGDNLHHLPSPVRPASYDSPYKTNVMNRFELSQQQQQQTPLSSTQFSQQQQQQFQQQQQQFQQQQQQTHYPLQNCSGKCRGLFIYFSRIIRPIWNLKAITVNQKQTPEGIQELLTSNISVDEIKVYLLRLTSLYSFLKKNMKFSTMETTDKYLNSSSTTFSINDQQLIERNLIFGLFKLIEHCLEVLNLWKLLCIHQFHVIVANLTKDKQNQLANMNFKELIVYGSEMTTMLASALVQRFIEDHSTTDIINRRLQDVCPSIYKNENALHAKVHEMILKSKSYSNENDRKILLDNALKLCKKIGPRINLQAICDLFQSINWYEAIVDICLLTGQQRDPQCLALHYYKNHDKMETDLQVKNIYDSRIECYRLLLDVYGRLVQQSKSLLCQRSSVTAASSSSSSSTTTAIANYPNPDDAKKYAQTILHMATQSNDELFHYILYNWLYEHNQMDKLLEIKSSYLETYLKEKTSEINDSIALMDFLWLYYERNGHFNAAAQILAKLAEQNSNEIPLYKRIEYLSRAIVCMKSLDARLITNGSYGSAGEFLHTLEEKIEVARIQMQLLTTLEKIKPPRYEEAIQMLNQQLLNVTTLYQDFAEPFKLYECQLKILHCAGHDDISLIENIWHNILDKELRSIRMADVQTRQTLLRNKIKELGVLYMNTEKFFPLELIITILESSNQNQTYEPYWLVETLLELKISLINLFEIYHKIYKSRINHKSTGGILLDPVDLLDILIYLINQNMNSIDRHFASKALDLISGYINDLLLFSSVFDSTDTKVTKIRQELNRTKIYLERYVK
uniref:Nuclear pore complex protein Nup155-like n=1 Tax=Dermatophagoides pteronyssinus TaxID=6956 RepID=A0A6P6YAU0_DERPT|nr:nuclear pore complex protein Nup155-like [Dermatophagoides pteronyssinus]